MSSIRGAAVWLGLGLAGTMPAAGWCFEAGAPAAAVLEQGGAGGYRTHGLKLDLGLGEGNGRLSLGALSGGNEYPFDAPFVPFAAPTRADGSLAVSEDGAGGERKVDRLEIAHSRRIGPFGYRLGFATGYRLGTEDRIEEGGRRYTVSGALAYDADGLPPIGLKAGLGYWRRGRPRLGALDMGSAWAVEGSVGLGELLAPTSRREAVRAMLRLGVTGAHGDAAPDQPRGVDFRIGIGASFRF